MNIEIGLVPSLCVLLWYCFTLMRMSNPVLLAVATSSMLLLVYYLIDRQIAQVASMGVTLTIGIDLLLRPKPTE